jgi:hypothetical protein
LCGALCVGGGSASSGTPPQRETLNSVACFACHAGSRIVLSLASLKFSKVVGLEGELGEFLSVSEELIVCTPKEPQGFGCKGPK